MAKFYGVIGYIKTVEVEPGIWEEQTIEHNYYGDITRPISRFQPSGGVNDDINVSNNISIVADPFANENFQYMRYVVLMGAKWKITNIEIQFPRLLLTVGGVYNENQTGTTN
jgi:hypothetical protein